ncbi:MAG TPA: non-heme iron oxygenase ferredoxin subunit [Candidatus Binatia bacterium]|nr:non-heme iron oxygenase ferredoxin subunit [Candidatus Binatia bacterium]
MSVEFHRAAAASKIAPDTGLHVTIGEHEIALFNLGGEFYAIGGICTHGAARLAEGYVEGELIECPQHAGTFEIKTGRAVDAPCTVDVPHYPVKVEGDAVLIGIES